MRRGRLLILIGLVLLLGTAGFFLAARPLLGPQLLPSTPTGTGPTALPSNLTSIVLVAQDIPRGAVIPQAAVVMAPWPASYLPDGALLDLSQAVGRLAFVDLRRGTPLLLSQIVENALDTSGAGSYAAVLIPPGKVAFTMPLERLSGVSLLMKPGDHLDVLISVLFVDLDQEFQSLLPNYAYTVQPPIQPEGAPASGEAGSTLGIFGPESFLCRRYDDSGFGFPFCEAPQETQRSRMVTQMIVRDAVVLHVGDSPLDQPEAIAPTPTPAPEQPQPTSTPLAGINTTPQAPVEEVVPDLITLVVAPQDALVLNYALKSGADFAFALRAAGDAALVDTESVTLQYLIERYRISLPAKLPYGTQPRRDEVFRPQEAPAEEQ